MAWVKTVIVLVVTVLMLVGATSFWTEMLRPPFGEINWHDFKILAIASPWYQGTVLVIVSLAGLLLWRWLRAQPR